MLLTNSIVGNTSVANFIAAYSNKCLDFLGANKEQTVAIWQWIEMAQTEIENIADVVKLDPVFQRLDWHLTHSSYIVGHRLTLADLVVYETLKRSKQWSQYQARYKKHIPALDRFFVHIDGLALVQTATTVLNGAVKKGCSTHDISPPTTEESSSDSDAVVVLPHAEMGKVVTRFPPEASGYLHIGHAKAALMNQYFAQKYNGKMLLRFDDTNPAKEKAEFEERIREDLRLLGIDSKKENWTHSSDYFDDLQRLAYQMIASGKAYVDDTPVEELRRQKLAMEEGANRNNSPEKNKAMFDEMIKGSDEGRKCVLRAKIDMKSENGTLRDPVLFRCKNEEHARHGWKYKAYPTYDFTCPVVDSLEGVTHALRTSEYNDRNAQYYWICDALGIRKPFIWDFSRLNFTYTVMSKRKLTKLVDIGAVDGWDDPRFPTVAGLMRRGLAIEALRQFILSQGASRSIATIEWENLWTVNKKYLDPIIPRYSAVTKKDAAILHLNTGSDKYTVEKKPKHPKNNDLGTKDVVYYKDLYLDQVDAAEIVDNEEITLMGWGNVIVKKIQKSDSGVVTELWAELNLKGSVKTTKKKLHWVAVITDAKDQHCLTDVKLVTYDYLSKVPFMDDNIPFEEQVDMNSKHESSALGDFNLRSLKKGDKIQLERVGYYVVDAPFVDESHPVVLIKIPDSQKAKATN
jgi:glutamyl-tRNA synthetase